MKTIMTLLLLLAVALPYGVLAQKEATFWYFGKNAGLDFTTSQPQALSNATMDTPEGCATISDKDGNLLFYTNGVSVWNKQHQLMANGQGLFGHPSSTQAALIVPAPGSGTLYYIFTTDAQENNYANGCRYSLVDMSRNNGNGEVISKNTLLLGTSSERIAAVRQLNNRDVWVVLHDYASRQYKAYLLTAGGIAPAPVVSNDGIAVADSASLPVGALKISPNGKKMAMSSHRNNVYIYDFDIRTGRVSNPIPLFAFNTKRSFYGIEFSPASKFLYVSDKFQLSQFYIPAGLGISNTNTPVMGGSNMGMLQLAPNGKIYTAHSQASLVSEIRYPDSLGISCEPRPGPALQGADRSLLGLPGFLTNFTAPPRFTYIAACEGAPVHFTITDTDGVDSVRWDFGHPTSGTANTASGFQTSHTFDSARVYQVTATLYFGSTAAPFIQDVQVLPRPRVALVAGKTILCGNEKTSIKNTFPVNTFNETYRWSTGETTTYIEVTTEGYYWLEVSNGTCTFRDSIFIKVNPAPVARINAIRSSCTGDPVLLQAIEIPGATYKWQDGSTGHEHLATKAGTYSVEVTLNGCSDKATTTVNFENLAFSLGEDRAYCLGDTIPLYINLSGASYMWSNGNRLPNITVFETGTYWAEAYRNGCFFRDSVHITFEDCYVEPIIIPNIITPNNDGLNETFAVSGIAYQNFTFEVYNRWGKQVYRSTSYQNNWDAAGLSDGMYYYVLRNPNTDQTFKGYIEVVR